MTVFALVRRISGVLVVMALEQKSNWNLRHNWRAGRWVCQMDMPDGYARWVCQMGMPAGCE